MADREYVDVETGFNKKNRYFIDSVDGALWLLNDIASNDKVRTSIDSKYVKKAIDTLKAAHEGEPVLGGERYKDYTYMGRVGPNDTSEEKIKRIKASDKDIVERAALAYNKPDVYKTASAFVGKNIEQKSLFLGHLGNIQAGKDKRERSLNPVH